MNNFFLLKYNDIGVVDVKSLILARCRSTIQVIHASNEKYFDIAAQICQSILIFVIKNECFPNVI